MGLSLETGSKPDIGKNRKTIFDFFGLGACNPCRITQSLLVWDFQNYLYFQNAHDTRDTHTREARTALWQTRTDHMARCQTEPIRRIGAWATGQHGRHDYARKGLTRLGDEVGVWVDD